MQDMINSFVASLVADGKSKCTVSAYSNDLKEFSSFMNQNIGKCDVSEIKFSDLRNWANNLDDLGLSASSRARKISVVKSFFSYLSDMEYIEGKNLASGLKPPKIPKKQPKVIGSDDAKNILLVKKNKNHITSFRDYTIISMFLFTGIRREELTNITLDDVDMEENMILIHGKGDKERVVFINDNLRPILSEYIFSHRSSIKTASTSNYLFPSSKNEKLNVSSVNKIVNKAMESAGIKEAGTSAHILRKWFATTVFKNTFDIATTSKLLGHSSPTVTMRYVSIGADTMRSVASTAVF